MVVCLVAGGNREITSCKETRQRFAGSIRAEEERIVFMQTLSDCHKYAVAMNAKNPPFPFYYSHNIK